MAKLTPEQFKKAGMKLYWDPNRERVVVVETGQVSGQIAKKRDITNTREFIKKYGKPKAIFQPGSIPTSGGNLSISGLESLAQNWISQTERFAEVERKKQEEQAPPTATKQKFRPRKPNEPMENYLQAKQTWEIETFGESGITMPKELTPTEEWEIEAEETIADIKSQIPSIAAGLGIDMSGAPAVDTGEGGANGSANNAVGKAKTQIQSLQDRIDELEAQETEKQKAMEKQKKSILAKLTQKEEVREEQKTQAELRQEFQQTALEQMGLEQKDIQQIGGLMDEITGYQQEIAGIKSEKADALGQIEQRGMPQTYIKGEKALTERQYNSKISAKAAEAAVASQKLQLLQGAWQDARTAANNAVQAALYDQRQKIEDIEYSIDVRKDLYNMLSKEDQTAWNREYKLAQDEYQKKQTDLQRKTFLIEGAVSAGVDLGWTMDYMKNNSYSELLSEFSERVAPAMKEAEGVEEETAYKQLYNEAVEAGYEGSYLNFLQDRGVIEEGEEEEPERTPELTDAVMRSRIRESIDALEAAAAEKGEEITIGELHRKLTDKITSNMNLTIADKERFYLIINEMLGIVEEEPTEEPTPETTKKPTKTKPETEPKSRIKTFMEGDEETATTGLFPSVPEIGSEVNKFFNLP